MLSLHVQASSLGFDGQPPQKGGPPEAIGDSRKSAERLDFSNFAQQKRSSVELGMGNISHAANINPGLPINLKAMWSRMC
jgi:hypothetical protein